MSRLQLSRPIVFFDLEATGIQVSKDRIVEISMLKVFPDYSEQSFHSLVNPQIPIPVESSAIHGITDKDVADSPTFKQLASRLAGFLEDCDLGGYNCNKFDIPLLVEEFLRAEVPVDFSRRKVIDVQTIFHKREQRTLVAAYKFYCHKELYNAHSAEADTRATYEVLLGQLERYDDLPGDVVALDEYTTYHRAVDYAARMVYDSEGREVINFGKYKGRLAEEVLAIDPGYYGWIMSGDFTRDTKREFAKIKMRLGTI